MTPEQIKKYNKASVDGSIPDHENPLFLFQATSAKLLVMGLNGEFSFKVLAKQELTDRGLNLKGEWIGFHQQPGRKKPAWRKGKSL